MSTQILDGKAQSERIIDQIKLQVDALAAAAKRVPSLAVILVGDDPASSIYVRNKRRACERAGVGSVSHDLPASTTQAELLALIDALNQDPDVDGILVQMPLPRQIDPETVIESIHPDKDVDGFHPYNIGRLAVRMPTLRSCTPMGVMTLLQSVHDDMRGLNALVVGASNHVGRPMGLELLMAGCTVTTANSQTRNLPVLALQADIVVVAVGKPNLVKGEWIKEGATVADVGINRLPDGRICGDVEFEVARQRAAWITPVPGGVGPMTVASLLQNTLQAHAVHTS